MSDFAFECVGMFVMGTWFLLAMPAWIIFMITTEKYQKHLRDRHPNLWVQLARPYDPPTIFASKEEVRQRVAALKLDWLILIGTHHAPPLDERAVALCRRIRVTLIIAITSAILSFGTFFLFWFMGALAQAFKGPHT